MKPNFVSNRRSGRRLLPVMLLALVLVVTAVAPNIGQAAEVAPAVIGAAAYGEYPGAGVAWATGVTSGKADPYPSTVTVSALAGNITNVTITLTELKHNRPDDYDIMLVGPTGHGVIIMSDACGTADVNLNLTFDQNAAGVLSDTVTPGCTSGTYLPSNFPGQTGDTDAFPDAVVSTTSASLADFNTTSPNGDWSLYVMDDQTGWGGENASIGSWTLKITTEDPVNTAPVIDPISNRAMQTSTTLDLTLSATDPDGDTVTFGASSSDTGIVTTAVAGNVLTLSAVSAGSATITVTATDGTNNATPVIFTVTVTDTPQPTLVGPTPGAPTQVPPTPQPTPSGPVYSAEDHRRAQAPLCMDLSGQTSPAVRAGVPDGAVPGGNVYCRVLARDGVFPNPADPGRVGDPGLITYGVITAVDVFGVTSTGFADPTFEHAVTVCLEGSGRFIFLSALNSPRTTFELASFSDGGYTCAPIASAGTVVLIPPQPLN